VRVSVIIYILFCLVRAVPSRSKPFSSGEESTLMTVRKV